MTELEKENEELKRKIRIKDKYCELIYDIGFDYDGYEKPESLKKLIDEIVSYAVASINNDDKRVMYIGEKDGKEIKENILMEEVK